MVNREMKYGILVVGQTMIEDLAYGLTPSI